MRIWDSNSFVCDRCKRQYVTDNSWVRCVNNEVVETFCSESCLKERVAARRDYSSLPSTPTTVRGDVLDAIRRFRERAGRAWKSKLWLCWEKASYPSWVTDRDKNYLQYARNASGYGPTWLDKLKTKDLE